MAPLDASGSYNNRNSTSASDTAFVLVGRRPLPNSNSVAYDSELPDTPHSSNSEEYQYSLPPSSDVDVDRNNQILSPLPESPRSISSPEHQASYNHSPHSPNAFDTVYNSNHYGSSRSSSDSPVSLLFVIYSTIPFRSNEYIIYI